MFMDPLPHDPHAHAHALASSPTPDWGGGGGGGTYTQHIEYAAEHDAMYSYQQHAQAQHEDSNYGFSTLTSSVHHFPYNYAPPPSLPPSHHQHHHPAPPSAQQSTSLHMPSHHSHLLIHGVGVSHPAPPASPPSSTSTGGSLASPVHLHVPLPSSPAVFSTPTSLPPSTFSSPPYSTSPPTLSLSPNTSSFAGGPARRAAQPEPISPYNAGERRRRSAGGRLEGTGVESPGEERDSEEEEGEGEFEFGLGESEKTVRERRERIRQERIVSEQKRRDDQREGFDRLKKVLPRFTSRVSKAGLLNRAVTLIEELKKDNATQRETVKELRRELESLQAKMNDPDGRAYAAAMQVA